MIPLARQWNVDPARFPYEWTKADSLYVGRIKGHRKMMVQFAWRRSDERFTAMLMGNLDTP